MWTYLSLIKTAWIYISSGALRDVIKLRKGPVIAALYPVGFFDCPTGFCDFVHCGPILSSLARAPRVWRDQLGDHMARACVVSEI